MEKSCHTPVHQMFLKFYWEFSNEVLHEYFSKEASELQDVKLLAIKTYLMK